MCQLVRDGTVIYGAVSAPGIIPVGRNRIPEIVREHCVITDDRKSTVGTGNTAFILAVCYQEDGYLGTDIPTLPGIYQVPVLVRLIVIGGPVSYLVIHNVVRVVRHAQLLFDLIDNGIYIDYKITG